MLKLSTILINTVLATASLASAADPLIGNWKLRIDKTSMSEEIKVTDPGQNRFKFDLGPGSDTLTADGTDHPIHFGRTESITQLGTNIRKVAVKYEGKIMSSATWTMSADGNLISIDGTEKILTVRSRTYTFTGSASVRVPGGAGRGKQTR